MLQQKNLEFYDIRDSEKMSEEEGLFDLFLD